MAEFYCYALIDPRCGKPFYIGKGKERRAWKHFDEARRGGDSAKCVLIREIFEGGNQVEVRILRRFRKEDAAYEYERRLIKRIGIENLTNQSPGGRVAWPIKPDEGKQRDLVWLSAVKKLAVIKNRGMVPVMRFCGMDFEIPPKVIEKTIAEFWRIYKERGPKWCARNGLAVSFE